MNHLRFISRVACVVALTIFGASFANAQTTMTIVNDSFADGITNMGSQQLDIISLSSSSAVDQSQAPGPFDFATGNSGRSAGSLFAPQQLAAFGDELEVTFDFRTPASIGNDNGVPSSNEDFRFGLFDSSAAAGAIDPVTNTPATVIDFTQNISAGSGDSQNSALNLVPGFFGEIDNINAAGTDIGIRAHDVNNVQGGPNGQFINSSSGFDQTGDGADDIVSLVGNTDYFGRIFIEYTDATLTSFDITAEIGDAAGTFLGSFTDTVLIADSGDAAGINTNTFDLIAFSATSGAFGGTDDPANPGGSSTGDPNNGIDISNVTIEFTTAVPEPGSAMLLLSGLAGLGFVRRRK